MNYLRFILLTLCLFFNTAFADEVIKLSKSGICHDTSSASYDKTKNFTAFDSIEECLKQGRLPKSYTGASQPSVATIKTSSNAMTAVPKYNRDDYHHWIDSDGNNLNTRHEVLLANSVSVVTYNKSKSRVLRGKWNDPYSGKVFYESSQLEIDHIVPLGWAHPRGAYAFSASQKETFANDMTNLLAVEASLNQEKGAKGPAEWLPPNHLYRCQYLARFHRIVLKYSLDYFESEKRVMRKMMESCNLSFSS